MKDLKIRVANEAESKEAQELFDALGYSKDAFENKSTPCWIAICDGLTYSDYNIGKSIWYTACPKEITIQELRAMVNQDQDEPFLTPETTLNDQYAEIEQVRKQTIEATLAERQAQYGCFEDVARTTDKIMEALSEVRVNGLNELPYPHRMALYMIASKMARIVNGNPNHKDSWHNIAGYATLIDNELVSEKDMPF